VHVTIANMPRLCYNLLKHLEEDTLLAKADSVGFVARHTIWNGSVSSLGLGTPCSLSV
jgi:hypothetical protein